MKMTCPIDFKLTGFIVQVNKSLCTDFQVILKISMITLEYSISKAIDTSYGPVGIQID